MGDQQHETWKLKWFGCTAQDQWISSGNTREREREALSVAVMNSVQSYIFCF